MNSLILKAYLKSCERLNKEPNFAELNRVKKMFKEHKLDYILNVWREK